MEVKRSRPSRCSRGAGRGRWGTLFVTRIAPAGDVAWAFAGPAVALEPRRTERDDTLPGLAVNAAGDAVVVGGFTGTATIGETTLTAAQTDVFYIGLGPDGTPRFARRAGGPDNERAYAATFLPTGSAIVAGYAGRNAVFGPGEPNETLTQGSAVPFAAEIAPDGALRWVQLPMRRIGVSAVTAFHAASAGPDGTATLAGTFAGPTLFAEGQPSEVMHESAGVHDVFVARMRP